MKRKTRNLNINTCPACRKVKDLVKTSYKLKVLVCDDCYIEENQSPLPFNYDEEMEKHRAALRQLQEQKKKQKRLSAPKSIKGKGRPKIEPAKIRQARELAKIFPITDVARKLGVSLSTLYSYGIKRYLIGNAGNDDLSMKE